MTGYGYRHSCRNLFKQLRILLLKSQYIYSVLLFVSKNRKLFNTNYDAHNLQTRHRNDLYLPTSTLTLYQKGVRYTGIKLFNNLPWNIKEIVGSSKQFKIALRRYLVTHCFYDLVEYYQVNEWRLNTCWIYIYCFTNNIWIISVYVCNSHSVNYIINCMPHLRCYINYNFDVSN
jgi:hypothetical protein